MKIRPRPLPIVAAGLSLLTGAVLLHPGDHGSASATPLRPPTVWSDDGLHPATQLPQCLPDGANNPPPCVTVDPAHHAVVLQTRDDPAWSVTLSRDTGGRWHAGRIDWQHDTTTPITACPSPDGSTDADVCLWDAGPSGTSFLWLAEADVRFDLRG
jgi:hypothetical protein